MKKFKIWRESASLILVAKSVFTAEKFNYKVLCLKRSSQSKFMPSTYVFPGGNYSSSDGDPNWMKLYEKFGFTKQSFNDLLPARNVPNILSRQEKNDSDALPKYLSLRICAIRETFEECGLLLCKSPKLSNDDSNNLNSAWASFVGSREIVKWQEKVHADPAEFVNLCSHFEILPDVWSLKNWSNWITPPAFKLKFDAMFFFAALDQTPNVQPDEKEVQSLMWTTPDECLMQNTNKTVMLPIPQFYEFSRLKEMPDVNCLAEFAKERSAHGCEMYWPYRIKSKEGTYSILPGDGLYPGEIDPENYDVPFVPDLPEVSVKNRVIFKTEFVNILEVKNLKPKCKHIVPSM